MKSLTPYLLAFIILVFAGRCNSSVKEKAENTRYYVEPSGIKSATVNELDGSSAMESKMKSEENPPTVQQNTNPEVVVEKKVIKTANLTIEVDKYETSYEKLQKVIEKYKGYIGKENESKSTSIHQNILEIRVPKESFDALVIEIIGLADELVSKQIDALDVTEQFIDIQSRLKNKKEVENQYHEILKKAYTVTDILQVQEHLRVIREEIDAKEGQLKYLENRADISTIHLNFYQSYEEVQRGFFGKIVKGIQSGWSGLLQFIIGIFYLWPLWIISGGIFYFIRRYLKRRKLRKTENNAI